MKYLGIPLLLIAGLIGCHGTSPKSSAKIQAATVDQEKKTVTLTKDAERRLGIVVDKISGEANKKPIRIPASALLYGPSGETFIYLQSAPETFQRRDIQGVQVSEGLVTVQAGVSPGDLVVKVGAAELYGAETGMGK